MTAIASRRVTARQRSATIHVGVIYTCRRHRTKSLADFVMNLSLDAPFTRQPSCPMAMIVVLAGWLAGARIAVVMGCLAIPIRAGAP